MIIKKCNKCGAIIEVIEDCKCENCGIKCCGEQMQVVLENSTECSIEKHVPNYEIVGEYIIVNVFHVMEDEHYISFIGINGENINAKKYFNPKEKPIAIFPYIKGSKIYSYCNKHGLWSIEVK